MTDLNQAALDYIASRRALMAEIEAELKEFEHEVLLDELLRYVGIR
jgi:hypothetical protein